MIFNRFIVIITILLFSCNKENIKENKKREDISFFNATDLGAYGSTSRVIISARFDECGEWGGHKETLEIFGKEDKKLYLNYSKNQVDCKKIDQIYDEKLVFIKVIELNEEHKKALNEYFYKLIDSKINEKIQEHSGKEFQILKTDSTLLINVYDNNPENPINYINLLEHLGIPVNKKT